MSDLLFKCSVCKKSLAVNTSLLGRRFVCPQCQTKVHAPKPESVFPCPSCDCELCAPLTLAMQDFECPNCEESLTIPELSIIKCSSCEVQIELSSDYYQELAGDVLECPECAAIVNVPPIPGEKKPKASKPGTLPKGFGHKTMRLDELLNDSSPTEQLQANLCPYCNSKIYVLQDNSYVCKACGRIMRIGTKTE